MPLYIIYESIRIKIHTKFFLLRAIKKGFVQFFKSLTAILVIKYSIIFCDKNRSNCHSDYVKKIVSFS